MNDRVTPKVGDVFYRSWGYDQTNVDFYELVSLSSTGKTGKAKRLKNVSVYDDGGPTTYVTAATGPGRFATDERCTRCSNHHRDANGQMSTEAHGWDGHKYSDTYTYKASTDQVTVTSYGDHAYRWDGVRKYETGVGWGH